MIIRKDKLPVEQRENVRGGAGTLTFTHFAEGKGAVQKNTNLLAEIALPPGGSIGPHVHSDETEFFIFTEGSGTVNDNGNDAAVQAGDVMITGNGASHSVTNTGNVPLKMIAAIIKG